MLFLFAVLAMVSCILKIKRSPANSTANMATADWTQANKQECWDLSVGTERGKVFGNATS